MRLPGFTAEASLRWKGADYRMADTHASWSVSGAVQPQFFTCRGNYCCDEWGYCIYKGHVLM